MPNRFCPTCKASVGGFAYCPKCGGATEVLENTAGLHTQSVFGMSASPSSNQSALWCHLAPLIITVIAALTSLLAVGFFLALLAWIPPLIIKSRHQEDAFVVAHAKESFNFQIFWLIVTYSMIFLYLITGILTLGIGLILGAILFILIAIPLIAFIMIVQIRGCSAANAGLEYKYPLVLFRVMR